MLPCLSLMLLAAAAAAGTMKPIAFGEIADELRHGPVLLLFRHGESEHNACPIFAHVYYGLLQKGDTIAAPLRLLWFNPSLTGQGRVQAGALGRTLAGLDLDGMVRDGKVEFWTSTMARAIETAALALPGRRFHATDLLQGQYAGIASGLRHSSGSGTAETFEHYGLVDVLRKFEASGPDAIRRALFPNGDDADSDALVATVRDRVRSILLALGDSRAAGQYCTLQETVAQAQLDIQLDCEGVAEVDPHFASFADREPDAAYLRRLRRWLDAKVTQPQLYVVSSHKHSVEEILSLGGLRGYDVGNGDAVCVAYRRGD